jgi:hypothetical protein
LAERKRERRRSIAIWSVTGVAVAALAAGGTWALMDQNREANRPVALPRGVSGSGTSAPPWSLPADPVTTARKAGLTVQQMEGTAKHFHAHLDVIVNGKPIAVPANIGISPAQQAMSELHTHDQRGVVHIEAPTKNKRYTLGQLFAEWDVHLNTQSVGGLATGGKNTLRAYVDGKQVAGDPADIELTPHRQIALVYGPADAKVNVPAKYAFEPGE